jgi:hypothetical protein
MQNIPSQNKPIENKPSISLSLGDGQQPEINADLQKALGDAVNKMLNPALANMTGELSEREKVLLHGLYMKSKRWSPPANKINYAALYAYDRIQKSVITDRKRATEMVEILKEIQQYTPKGFLQRAKERVGLG